MSLCKASKYFQVCFGTFFLYFADCFSYILEREGSISPSFHLSFFSKFTDVLFLLTLFALVNQCSFSQVPYATLHDKVNKAHPKKLGGGGVGVVSIVPGIGSLHLHHQTLTNWKIPFDGFGVGCLVKAYVDQEILQIKYFKNNFPGPDWLQGFIKHHRLTHYRQCKGFKSRS